MPKQRQVTIASGGGYTSILATIPVHYLKIWPNGDRNVQAMNYKLPNDDFTTVYTTDVSLGDILELIGPGRHGHLGYPDDVLIQIKFADDSEKIVNVYESESSL